VRGWWGKTGPSNSFEADRWEDALKLTQINIVEMIVRPPSSTTPVSLQEMHQRKGKNTSR
jgi:hypothetical protein